jgi:hypothetical protein
VDIKLNEFFSFALQLNGHLHHLAIIFHSKVTIAFVAWNSEMAAEPF